MTTEYQQTLLGIQSSTSDDCVRILTETGTLFKETRERIKDIREALTDKAIDQLRKAKTAIDEVWPRLAFRTPQPEVVESVEELKGLLGSDQLLDQLDKIDADTHTIITAYCSAYLDLFDRRQKAYAKAIEDLRNQPEWEVISPEAADTLLGPLKVRVGADEDRDRVDSGGSLGRATLTEMESDLAAVEGLKASVLAQLRQITLGKQSKAPVRRVRVAEFLNKPILSQQDLETALTQLRDELQKIIDEGGTIVLE